MLVTSDGLRATEVVQRCCCRMKVVNNDGKFYGHDLCTFTTSGPDEPICRACQMAGHPTRENFDPAIPKRSNR